MSALHSQDLAVVLAPGGLVSLLVCCIARSTHAFEHAESFGHSNTMSEINDHPWLCACRVSQGW